MAEYNSYINELKRIGPQPDFDRLSRAIKASSAPQPVWPAVWSVAGVATVCLIGFALYFNFEPGANSETVSSYLNEGTAVNGSELMSYVFQE